MKNEQRILFLLFRDAIESFMHIHVIQLYNNCNVAIFNLEVSSGVSIIIQLIVFTCNKEVDALEPGFCMVEMLLQCCTVQQAIAEGGKDGAAKRRPPRTKFLDNNASRESKRDPNVWHRAEELNYQ